MSPSNVSKPSDRRLCDRILADRWNASPPWVTSYLSIPGSGTPSGDSKIEYDSPTCGLGWQYHFIECFRSQPSTEGAQAQELVGQLNVSYKPPPLFSALPLRNVGFHVQVTYPQRISRVVHEERFSDVSLKSSIGLGSYMRPACYEGRTIIAITLTFNELDGLSFPTSPPAELQSVLHQSLDGPTFIDTKFYLYSAKKIGVPTRPKAVFANSKLLLKSSPYLHDLLSSETGFQRGSSCNLQEDVAGELSKLTADAFDYDSDSDLESLCGDDEDSFLQEGGDSADTSTDKEEDERMTPSPDAIQSESSNASQSVLSLSPGMPADGRAFAINGTAYRTWKALIFYIYTKDIRFKKLKSQNVQGDISFDIAPVTCSPKSMYRLADYAGLPELKTLAKKSIQESLTKSNVVYELFSTFTHRYQEIIEMEVDFLLKEFTPQMGRELDEMIQLIVTGTKPHCGRVLSFVMRRQRGESSGTAWKTLDSAKLELEPEPAGPGSRPVSSQSDRASMVEISVPPAAAGQPSTIQLPVPVAPQAQVYHPPNPPAPASVQPRFHFFSPVPQSQSSSSRPAGPLYFNPRFQSPRNRPRQYS